MAAQRRRGWRYFATELHGNGTETMLDPDLPLEEVEIEDVLSGDGAITGTISPTYSRLLNAKGAPLLSPWRTAIYAESDGEIRAGGILQESPIVGPSLSIEAVGYTGYLRDLPYTGSGYKGIRVDPIDVVRAIWTHAQAQPGGNLGLRVATTNTGGRKTIGTELKQVEFDTQSGPASFESGPYRLNWYTNHDLAGDIDDLAEETPFDYHERHVWNGDVIEHHLDIGYPKLGRRRTDLSFTLGVNVFEDPEVERSGESYASGTMVLGAGEGAAMIKSIREPAVRPPGLRRIAVIVDDTISSKSAADKRADAENQWRSRPDDITSIVVADHPDAPVGAAQPGDEIFIRGRGDWGDIGMWVRILSILIIPAANAATYSVARTDKLLN